MPHGVTLPSICTRYFFFYWLRPDTRWSAPVTHLDQGIGCEKWGKVYYWPIKLRIRAHANQKTTISNIRQQRGHAARCPST